MKRYILLALSVVLALTLLCSCSNVNIKDVSVIATVNGEDIPKAEYDYFLLFAKQSILATASAAQDNEEFWTTTEIDGKKAEDLAKETALEDAISYTLLAQEASKQGISADAEAAKEQISSALSSEYSQMLITQYGLTEEGVSGVLKKLYLESALLQKLEAEGTIDVSEENLKSIYENNFRTIKHILISFTDSETGETVYTDAEALDLANKTITRINSGESFDSVMNEVSTDPGLETSPNGYTFTNNGTMVAPFEQKAFELEIDEISAPVATPYGYHILKREPLISFEDFLAENNNDISVISIILEEEYVSKCVEGLKANSKIERNENNYKKVSLY